MHACVNYVGFLWDGHIYGNAQNLCYNFDACKEIGSLVSDESRYVGDLTKEMILEQQEHQLFTWLLEHSTRVQVYIDLP